MKRILLVLLYFSLSRITAISQTVQADVVTPFPSDQTTYDNQYLPNYSLKWTADSWRWGGYSAWLSGYAGVKLFTNSTPRLAIDYNGNVGIGTTSPSRKLQVVGDASFSDVVYFDRAGANIRLKSDGTDAKDATLFTDVSGNIYLSDWNNNRGLKISQNGNSSFKGGNFGIGTSSPAQNFVVSDDGRDGFEVFLQQPTGTVGVQAFNRTESAYKQMLLAASGFSFVQGNVGINTPANNIYTLAVNGSAIFTKAVVKNYSNWPDYVFDPSYQLPSLDSVSSFIQTNKHLPDMPSAATVEKDGHDLGEVQKILLKKMEEVTLYLIEQEKLIKTQREEISQLKTEVSDLKKIKK